MSARQRLHYPSLALLFTSLAFALVCFSGFLGSSPLMRLLQGQTPFASLPIWLRYCLLHPLLLKTLARAGFGFSLLGSMLTLFLLLKTESPTVAYRHLAGIGWAVLLITVPLFGLVLGAALFPMIPIAIKNGGTGQLTKVLLIFLPAVPILCALFFVVVTIPFSYVKILGRLKEAIPARQSLHVLQ